MKLVIYPLYLIHQDLEIGSHLTLHHIKGAVGELLRPLEVLNQTLGGRHNLELQPELLFFGSGGIPLSTSLPELALMATDL